MPGPKRFKPLAVGGGERKVQSSPNLGSRPLTSTPVGQGPARSLPGNRNVSGDQDYNRNLVIPDTTDDKIKNTHNRSQTKVTKNTGKARARIPTKSGPGPQVASANELPPSSSRSTGPESLQRPRNADIDVVDGGSGRAMDYCNDGEVAGHKSLNGMTFTTYCKANNIDPSVIRKACRQPVTDNGETGLVYDTFKPPAPFAVEDLSPLPPTPVATVSSLRTYDEHDQTSPRKEASKAHNHQKKVELERMNATLQQMNEREELGVSHPNADGDTGSDLNGSFIAEYSPSPIILSDRIKKRLMTNKLEAHGEVTPPKRSRMSDFDSDVTPGSSDCVAETPRNNRASTSFDSFSSTFVDSFHGRRRLFAEDEEEEPEPTQNNSTFGLKEEQDEEEWSGDEILTQMDFSALEIASSSSSSMTHGSVEIRPPSSQRLSQNEQEQRVVSGEGFDESDDEADVLLTQLNY